MKVKEVIEELQKLNPDIECLMAINKSPGFESADIIDYYPIESVFGQNLDEGRKDRPRWEGYCEDNDTPEKAVVYVYP